MSRTTFPFAAHDVSILARSLSRELEALSQKPSHVQMLNMLARSAGYQNYQHFRAQAQAQDRLDHPPAPPAPAVVDLRRVERTARHFTPSGQLIRWPPKAHQRLLCLWVLWSVLPPAQVLNEAQINERLTAEHLFGDHALLRRELFDNGLVTRTPDCRQYRRLEQPPPAEAAALIRHIRLRRNA
jgi:hypothetical protein